MTRHKWSARVRKTAGPLYWGYYATLYTDRSAYRIFMRVKNKFKRAMWQLIYQKSPSTLIKLNWNTNNL